MALYRDSSGELALSARPTSCRVCGMPTDQPPVCFDLRCEQAYNEKE